MVKKAKPPVSDGKPQTKRNPFHLEFLNQSQKMAYSAFEQHDVLFLIGPAGCGKSFLATAFAIQEILNKKKRKIVLTRPIVESGENLGFLPGTFQDKVNPYMMPLYDCMDAIVGSDGHQREIINKSVEIAPLAYLRGRSQPLDAKILTPTGYVEMGQLKVGDKVIGSDGHSTEIIAVHPQGELDVYRMHFSDGSSVECSDDHLWATMSLNEKRYKKGYKARTTKQIRENLKNKRNVKNYKIPLSEPVHFNNDKTLPINPYILGVILGDGHIGATTYITNSDKDLIENVSKFLPEGMQLNEAINTKNESKAKSYRITRDLDFSKKNPFTTYFKEVGLFHKKSYDKFIPTDYLYTSVENRLELLRGLLDTDGCIWDDRGVTTRIQYYSTSEQLAKDTMFLVHSLGGTASIRKRDFNENDWHEYKGRIIHHCRAVYILEISIKDNPFKIKRKADLFKPRKLKRLICDVEYVGKKECQCISVSAENNLYLTEHCIVTHNSIHNAICILDEAQNATYMQMKLFMTRFGSNSKIIITGDPNQSDIRNPALMDIVKKLEDLPGIGIVHFNSSCIVRHPLIASILERLEDNK